MLKKYPVALYALWLIALLIWPLPLVILLNTEMRASALAQLRLIDAGVIAYAWWLFEVFLATRPQWLDRKIGLPATYFMHSLLGFGALILAFFHRHYLVTMGRAIQLTGDWAWYLTIFGLIYAAVFLSGWLVDRVPVVAGIKQRWQHFFKHQFSIWVHRLNLVVILLIWSHVHLIGRINNHLGFMITFDLYTVVILGAYLWQKWLQPQATMKGQVLYRESINATTEKIGIQLNQPKKNIMVGDYFFFTFPEISKEAHPFSITNTPNKQQQIELMVRTLGDYTKQLPQLEPGSAVLAEGPFGRFGSSLKETGSRPLVLIGMGAGVAPLLSIVQTYRNQRPIRVLWTVKTEADLNLGTVFQNVKSDQFKFHQQIGRLTAGQLKALITDEERQQALFITVGPAAAVLSLEKQLHQQLGIAKKQLIDERLTL
ncbi:FAD-binding oxidoreductase [Agrilactobacillus yilanensis]|uniref:FAD-binding oxidoreductase n=1 Tax=Agrilactobacillus yilanensis TaxID=2485997 RepID=A0ABW4J6G9_9LACO|nr:FAD-binding oxidoreductase [Agrilactobacillus yilanensis]